MYIYPWQIDPPPIEHRCLEYHYTHGRLRPSSQSSIDTLNTATPNLADGHPHQSFEHRCLEYHYIKLGRWTPHQLNRNALNITTPNLADGPPINQA